MTTTAVIPAKRSAERESNPKLGSVFLSWIPAQRADALGGNDAMGSM
jgi:hypothetical protein